MPDNVFFGKDGTVLTVDGNDLLGKFETISGSYENTVVEHNGPQDTVHYSTAVRTKCTIEIGGYVSDSGGVPAMNLVKTRTAVAVSSDLIFGGQTIAGTFTPVSGNAETQTEPSKYRLTLESYGDWTVT